MREHAAQDDPWEAPDPALALALAELRSYRRRMARARIANQISEVLVLLALAATTVAAALASAPWLTALLATVSLVLTALRKTFDWRGTWAASATRWSRLRTAVHRYRLLPEERRDDEAARALVAMVDEVSGIQTEDWAPPRHEQPDEPGRS